MPRNNGNGKGNKKGQTRFDAEKVKDIIEKELATPEEFNYIKMIEKIEMIK